MLVASLVPSPWATAPQYDRPPPRLESIPSSSKFQTHLTHMLQCFLSCQRSMWGYHAIVGSSEPWTALNRDSEKSSRVL